MPALKDIFVQALGHADRAARAAYLEHECAGDAALRARIEALLRASEASDSYLNGATAAYVAATPVDADLTGTTVAGRYKLVERIGTGGMGSVYMAQQTEPVRRAVAVKVIRAGHDSSAVLARFEAERQALALMDHPNIAKFYDAGAADNGSPYFVMELVKGIPITQFCDERKLTPRQRLELFVPVCQAIQHAHQKGVIHRDIKPSNVLVALYDDRPVPKVIDFGIAKATGPTLTDHTLLTGFGAVVGTPEYMSPEQASFNQMDVDTRSDVYALGVLLYELLTGTTPVDRKSLKEAALLEILRIVREVEPPRPSTKLSSSDVLPSLAANRHTEPAKLSLMLKGELDWVVMKALEKDRTRRYETANALARDVQRYLADEFVEARPPSAGYRLRKFARRHKRQVIAAALLFAALTAGVIGTSVGWREALRQRQYADAARLAEAERADGEREARAQTQARLEQIQKGNALLGGIFADLDIRKLEKDGEKLEHVLGERLKASAAKLQGEAVGDPLVVAELQTTMARSLRSLGYFPAALGLDEAALATRRRQLGPSHADTLTSQNSLALGLSETSQFDRALPLYEEVLARRRADLGAGHPDTRASLNNLAEAYRDAGRLTAALPLHEELVNLRAAELGPSHPDTLISLNNLAGCYRAADRAEQAVPLYETALRHLEARYGSDHPDTLATLNNLAAAHWQCRRLDRSIPLLERAWSARRRKLGDKHPLTLQTQANLGVNYKDAGRLTEALPLLAHAVRDGRDLASLTWIQGQLRDSYRRAVLRVLPLPP